MFELLGILTAIFILFVISALVSGSETALFSLKPHDLETLEEKDAIALTLLSRPRRLLIVILLTNMIVNTLAASLIEIVAQDYFAAWSIVFSIVVGTLATLVFGEIGPKSIALRHKIGYASFTGPFLKFLEVIQRPFVFVLLIITKKLANFFEGGPDEIVTEEDIKSLVSHSEDIGALDRSEERWINSIFDLDQKCANDLLTPKNNIFALPKEISFDEALEAVHQTDYSRIPLYAGTKDQIVGVLYARDLLLGKARGQYPKPIRLCKRPLFVPQWKRCDLLLAELRRRKTHMAVVVDEFGNTVGLITLEDILEAIVGDIADRRRERAERR